MRESFKRLLFSGILISYSLIYVATSVDKSYCDDECQKFGEASASIKTNRPYVYYLNKCTYPELVACLIVRDTTAIDWNNLADTACIYLTSSGINKYKVFVIAIDTSGITDTLAEKQCQ